MGNTESAVESPLLTTKETCKYLRLGRTKVNSLRRNGEIRVVYLAGRSPRYLKSDLDAFIERGRSRCGA